jgi:hypothetical protein
MNRCSLFEQEIVVNHTPGSHADLLKRSIGLYDQVLNINTEGEECPPSLRFGQVGYDGLVVPIRFKFAAFTSQISISCKDIIQEMQGCGIRQTSGYELALACASTDFYLKFESVIKQNGRLMVISLLDKMFIDDRFWVCCAEIKPGKKIFRIFYAGLSETYHFPIGGREHMVAGVVGG